MQFTSGHAAGDAGGGRVPVVLLRPGPLGSSMLLQQAWVLLLRFLLQVGGVGVCVKACCQ